MSIICAEIHRICNQSERYCFPFAKEDIPVNGVYILFEKYELGHGLDRIVRVGTHKAQNGLYKRLRDHFIKERRTKSIFRRNIGRVLLNKTGDDYLNTWNKKYEKGDLEKYEETEKQVTQIIQNNFSFVVLKETIIEKRLFLESKLISTIASCQDCRPSPSWLGAFSPERKIQESGLWQTQHQKKIGPYPKKNLNN